MYFIFHTCFEKAYDFQNMLSSFGFNYQENHEIRES